MNRYVLLISVILSSCSHISKVEYPKHWWKPVTEKKSPSWEILPQAAKSGEVILSKRNELGILSNFSKTPFIFKGQFYNSVEGFWQMMKYPELKNDTRAKSGTVWPISREKLSKLSSFEAKKYGDIGTKNMKELGINWVSFEGRKFSYWTIEKGKHYKLIKAAMIEKMEQNPEVKKILLSTGNLILRADHHQSEPHYPAWMYNEIWMEIRSELQEK